MEELFIPEGRREMAESLGWLFVDCIPLLYDKRRVARQFQVEAWLDLTQLVKELGIEKPNESKRDAHSAIKYVV
jgi:hypothetical protein